MSTPEGPFTVTPRGRATSTFTTQATADNHARWLRDEKCIPSIVTDGTGREVSTHECACAPFVGGRAVPGVYTAEQAAR